MQRDTLRNARLALGLSALRVSELTGIRECRLYGLERGRGRLHRDEAILIGAALNVPPETLAPEIFTGEEARRP